MYKRQTKKISKIPSVEIKGVTAFDNFLADLKEQPWVEAWNSCLLYTSMVHDLDLIAVDREDVLLAGIGVGVLACGDGRRIGICGLCLLYTSRCV